MYVPRACRTAACQYKTPSLWTEGQGVFEHEHDDQERLLYFRPNRCITPGDEITHPLFHSTKRPDILRGVCGARDAGTALRTFWRFIVFFWVENSEGTIHFDGQNRRDCIRRYTASATRHRVLSDYILDVRATMQQEELPTHAMGAGCF